MAHSQNQVVVLFGGTSSERLVATASAQHVAAETPDATFWFWVADGSVVEVSRSELMAHENPFKVSFEPRTQSGHWQKIEEALDEAAKRKATLVLALHGGEGEDGSVQRKLEARRLAFTGSDAASSAAAFDKDIAKSKLKDSGIKLADALCVNTGNQGDCTRVAAFLSQHGSVVCKPKRDGSSVGLAFLDSAQGLDDWWNKVSQEQRDYIIEERVFGREFTVGVADLGKGLLPLPVSEVVITSPGGAFDYDGKYLGRGTKEITPASVTREEQDILQNIGLTAHRQLGCFGYSRTDVIMGPKGAYFLETNTLPGLTRASFIPQQLAAAGISMKEFLAAQIELAAKRLQS